MTLVGTRPHVKAAGEVLGKYFGFADSEMGGVRPDSLPDHPSGVAIDFMGGKNMSRDVNLFTAVQSRPAVWNYLNVQYLIWQQTYYDAPGKAGSHMADRGSPTANHMDHVHITFKQLGPIPTYDGFLGAIGGGAAFPVAGAPTADVTTAVGDPIADSVKQVYDAITALVGAFSFLTKPENWKRIAWFVLGIVLAGIGLFRLDVPGAGNLANAATKAVA